MSKMKCDGCRMPFAGNPAPKGKDWLFDTIAGGFYCWECINIRDKFKQEAHDKITAALAERTAHRHAEAKP